MKKRKIAAAILSLFILISTIFTGCSQTTYKNSTVVGKITDISENSIKVTLGTLENSDNKTDPSNTASDSSNNEPLQIPSGDSNSDNSNNSGTNNTAPPQMPSGNNESSGSDSGSNSGTNNTALPKMPSVGENQTSDSSGNTQPQRPSSGQNGTMQAPPDQNGTPQKFTEGKDTLTIDLSKAVISSNNSTVTVNDLSVGTIIKVTFDSDGVASDAQTVQTNTGNPSAGGSPTQPNSSSSADNGTAATEITKDSTYKSKTYTSTSDDENALRVSNSKVTLDSITVDKSAGSSSNAENGDFYGTNAALLVTDGATANIKNATVKSSAQNGNGIFSYGSSTTVNVENTKITTTKDNSGGIQTTGGGTMNATNLTVSTAGNSSAAIRSDRGGGTVNVNKGTYKSSGYNSPAVYSTADITVKNATLSAENSEALVIEGKNSIKLENCNVSGNMSDTKGSSSSENVHNVMIYQSMSGDADVGTSEFSMTGGTLTSNNGDMFYVTNTDCNITLSGVKLINKDSDAYLMNICGNSASKGWGTAGKNGANVTFKTSGQTLRGKISVDDISTLNMTLGGKSTFTGTVNIVSNKYDGTAVSNNAVVTVESGSVWNLTGNCKITSLTNNGTINFNGYTITLADGTVLK